MKIISLAVLGAVALSACSSDPVTSEGHEPFGPVEFCYFYDATGTQIDSWSDSVFDRWETALDTFIEDLTSEDALPNLRAALAPLGDELEEFRTHVDNIASTVDDPQVAQEIKDLAAEFSGPTLLTIDLAADAADGEEFFVSFGSANFDDLIGSTDFTLLNAHFDAHCETAEE